MPPDKETDSVIGVSRLQWHVTLGCLKAFSGSTWEARHTELCVSEAKTSLSTGQPGRLRDLIYMHISQPAWPQPPLLFLPPPTPDLQDTGLHSLELLRAGLPHTLRHRELRQLSSQALTQLSQHHFSLLLQPRGNGGGGEAQR